MYHELSLNIYTCVMYQELSLNFYTCVMYQELSLNIYTRVMYQELSLKPGFACKFNFPYKSKGCMLISEFLKAKQNSRGSTKFPIGQ